MAQFEHTETGEELAAANDSMLARRLARSPLWEPTDDEELVAPGSLDGGSEDYPGGDAPAFPEGDPSEDWTRDELNAYADSIEVEGASGLGNKGLVLEAITAKQNG